MIYLLHIYSMKMFKLFVNFGSRLKSINNLIYAYNDGKQFHCVKRSLSIVFMTLKYSMEINLLTIRDIKTETSTTTTIKEPTTQFLLLLKMIFIALLFFFFFQI